MKTKWQFGNDLNTVENHGSGQWTWAGVIPNEIRPMIDKALRDQGISINSHGVEFFDKCLVKYLNQAEKTVAFEIESEVTRLRALQAV